MKRLSGLILAAALGSAATVSAHHAYSAYLLDHRITIAGELQDIRLANPHVILRIRTADNTLYTCVWQGASWVERNANVTEMTFKPGDYLVVYGAPSRNRNVKELASLRELRRPKDGWVWRANFD